MSMFRKPKKPMLRKVFNDDDEKMEIDQDKSKDRDRDRSRRDREKDRDRNRNDNRDASKQKVVSSSTSASSSSLVVGGVEKKKALLSFADDVDGKLRENGRKLGHRVHDFFFVYCRGGRRSVPSKKVFTQ